MVVDRSVLIRFALDPGNMRLHAFLNRACRQVRSIFFSRQHLNKLPTARDERRERLRLLIRHRAD